VCVVISAEQVTPAIYRESELRLVAKISEPPSRSCRLILGAAESRSRLAADLPAGESKITTVHVVLNHQLADI
jgi:hypothetical protein